MLFNSLVIAQIVNPIAELVITVGISSKETKTNSEMQPVTVQAKIRKRSI